MLRATAHTIPRGAHEGNMGGGPQVVRASPDTYQEELSLPFACIKDETVTREKGTASNDNLLHDKQHILGK